MGSDVVGVHQTVGKLKYMILEIIRVVNFPPMNATNTPRIIPRPCGEAGVMNCPGELETVYGRLEVPGGPHVIR